MRLNLPLLMVLVCIVIASCTDYLAKNPTSPEPDQSVGIYIDRFELHQVLGIYLLTGTVDIRAEGLPPSTSTIAFFVRMSGVDERIGTASVENGRAIIAYDVPQLLSGDLYAIAHDQQGTEVFRTRSVPVAERSLYTNRPGNSGLQPTPRNFYNLELNPTVGTETGTVIVSPGEEIIIRVANSDFIASGRLAVFYWAPPDHVPVEIGMDRSLEDGAEITFLVPETLDGHVYAVVYNSDQLEVGRSDLVHVSVRSNR